MAGGDERGLKWHRRKRESRTSLVGENDVWSNIFSCVMLRIEDLIGQTRGGCGKTYQVCFGEFE